MVAVFIFLFILAESFGFSLSDSFLSGNTASLKIAQIKKLKC